MKQQRRMKLMTTDQMNQLMDRIQAKIKSTRESGQKEYAHNIDNVFANFERVGNSLDISREKALTVYLLKHIDGVMSYLRDIVLKEKMFVGE